MKFVKMKHAPLLSLQSAEELVEEGHMRCVVGEYVTIASR
jgi:hypothetical protein